jgi:hypothetical protein
MRNSYVLDPVIKLFKESTASSIPEHEVAEAAWGPDWQQKLQQHPNALNNLMNRVRDSIDVPSSRWFVVPKKD